jgi:hypothetical protein
MPVSRPFDGFVEYTKRVTPTCLESGGAKTYHGSGGIVPLRAA